MTQSNVSFEMNDKLRNNMEELCDELGMSMDDAFRLFARKMVNEQGIPFEVTEKEVDDDETETVRKVVKWTAIAAALISCFCIIRLLVRKLVR